MWQEDAACDSATALDLIGGRTGEAIPKVVSRLTSLSLSASSSVAVAPPDELVRLISRLLFPLELAATEIDLDVTTFTSPDRCLDGEDDWWTGVAWATGERRNSSLSEGGSSVERRVIDCSSFVISSFGGYCLRNCLRR